MKKRTFIVAHRRKEGWVIVRQEVTTSGTSAHSTQAEAVAEAESLLRQAGGGVVSVRTRMGRLRVRRVIAAGPGA